MAQTKKTADATTGSSGASKDAGPATLSGQVVIAIYRPKPGKDADVRAILRRHVSTLRAAGLVTSRPVTLLQSFEDGTYLELFEWKDAAAAGKAHSTPAVAEMWKAFDEVATFVPLTSLAEANARFPHFRPVDGVVS